MKILIIDDDPAGVEILEMILAPTQATVRHACNGEMGILMAKEFDPSLILLDYMLPGIDGLQTTRSLRKITRAPIMVLSVLDDPADIVTGLNNGADDYLIKPFHLQELLARIRALLRRDLRARKPILRIREISLDPVEKVVWKSDRRIQLTRKEFGILEYLMRHPNEVISQEELLEHVWGTMTNVFSNTVRVHIQSLREKLEDDSTTPKYIETVIGTGYRFVQLEYESTEDIPNKESANE